MIRLFCCAEGRLVFKSLGLENRIAYELEEEMIKGIFPDTLPGFLIGKGYVWLGQGTQLLRKICEDKVCLKGTLTPKKAPPDVVPPDRPYISASGFPQ